MTGFEHLLEAVLAGDATPEQRAEFAQRIATDAALRHEFAAQMKLHALLEWRSGKVGRPTGVNADAKVVAFPQPASTHANWLAIAALFAVLCAIGAMFWPRGEKATAVVAMEVLHATGVTLAGEGGEPRVGSRFARHSLDLRSGVLRVRLDSGAILGAEAPAKIELLDSMHIRVLAGRITADAGAAHGFTVETARTKVVDLGTRFGVDASERGTDVVVFDGAVELHDGGAQPGAPQRLEQGEALRLGAAGAKHALVSIATGAQPEQWSAGPGGLFRVVRDNRRAADALKFYEIVPGGLREDTRAYVDRTHEWNGVDAAGLPDFLRGADLIRTFNEDKREIDLEVTVELTQPATLYLFLEKNPPPAWVAAAGFADTGAKIGLDEGPSPNRNLTTGVGTGVSIDRVFSIWKLEVLKPRAIQLGPPRERLTGAKAMYGIAARRLIK